MWLIVIVLVAVIGSIAFDGVLWGVIGGVIALVVSEVSERIRRRRLARDEGRPAPSPLSNVAKRRKR